MNTLNTSLSPLPPVVNMHFLGIATKFVLKNWMKVAQSCLTLCDPMDYTVHGILQARILEWVAIPFSRGSSRPRDWTQVSRIAGGFFTSWATRSGCENTMNTLNTSLSTFSCSEHVYFGVEPSNEKNDCKQGMWWNLSNSEQMDRFFFALSLYIPIKKSLFNNKKEWYLAHY